MIIYKLLSHLIKCQLIGIAVVSLSGNFHSGIIILGFYKRTSNAGIRHLIIRVFKIYLFPILLCVLIVTLKESAVCPKQIFTVIGYCKNGKGFLCFIKNYAILSEKGYIAGIAEGAYLIA